MNFKQKAIAALEELKGDCTGIIAATIEDCQKVIGDIPEDAGWIPVTERLPEKVVVLATDGKGLYLTNGDWFYKSTNGKTRIPANYGAGADVTHWMPLPAPPKEGE